MNMFKIREKTSNILANNTSKFRKILLFFLTFDAIDRYKKNSTLNKSINITNILKRYYIFDKTCITSGNCSNLYVNFCFNCKKNVY